MAPAADGRGRPSSAALPLLPARLSVAESEVLLEGKHVALVHDGLDVVLVRVGRAEEAALEK